MSLKGIKKIVVAIFISGFGKFLGFIREVLVASMYGVSHVTDAFFASQQVFLIISNYMFGAFNMAFVPHYIKLKSKNSEKFFSGVIFLLLLGIGILINGVLIFWINGYIKIFSTTDLLGNFVEIMSYSVVPTLIVGLAYAIFHAEGRHYLANFIGIAMTVGMLATLLFYWVLSAGEEKKDFLYALPFSYLIGTLLSFLLVALVGKKYLAPNINLKNIDKSFVKSLSSSSVENVFFNINQSTTVYFAAIAGAGVVASNAYAMRVAMLPLGIISSQLGNIYQTWIGKKITLEEKPSRKVFFAMCLPGVVIAIFMIAFGGEIIKLIYERGNFSKENTAQVVELLTPYAAYFVVMSINQLAARHFFALNKGAVYVGLMVFAYIFASLGKYIFSDNFINVLWVSVLFEGFVSLVMCAMIWRGR